MRRPRWTRLLGWLAAGLLSVATARSSFAENLDWKLSSSLNYESGDFGTDTRSSSLYVPLTLKRYWGDWDGSVTVPFLSQKTDGRVTNVGGRPVKTRKGRGAAATTTQSGLGDVVVRGAYALMREDPQPFDLSLAGKIKLPTADKDKGLGTGKFDEGLGAEFGKRLMPDWTLLAGLYYTIIGSPAGTDLRNQLAADFGFSHLLLEDWTLTVLVEAGNAIGEGEPAPLGLRGNLDYALGEQGSVFGGALVGLSNGSPDYGFSLGAGYRF